jgi:hypothetical protein
MTDNCEERSDEAIQTFSLLLLDCFASLAMTDILKQHHLITKARRPNRCP